MESILIYCIWILRYQGQLDQLRTLTLQDSMPGLGDLKVIRPKRLIVLGKLKG